jgi:hypothetical protein
LESFKYTPKLAELPEQYEHSSAKFYITGEQGAYPITSYVEQMDIDLTSRYECRKILA